MSHDLHEAHAIYQIGQQDTDGVYDPLRNDAILLIKCYILEVLGFRFKGRLDKTKGLAYRVSG